MEELVKCVDCNTEVKKENTINDCGDIVCKDCLNDTTGYCSYSCQRGFGCDGTC